MNAKKIADNLGKASRSGQGWICRCPAHEDRTPSLSVKDGEAGNVLVHCHAGCTQEEVISVLRDRGLWKNPTFPHSKHQNRLKNLDDWKLCGQVDLSHPYLMKKKISPLSIRQMGDHLVVPIFNSSRQLISLQSIAPNGEKKFLAGSKIREGYLALGKLTEAICICEGYATGASVHLSTGLCVVVAFSAGNLESVGSIIGSKFPTHRLIFCADHDLLKRGNPGLKAALKASRTTNGFIVAPTFQDKRENGGDFSDLYLAEGKEEVARQIENAARPSDNTNYTPQVSQEITIRSLFGKKPKPIPWLWSQVIPLGELTLLYGRAGVGKSSIARSIAALLSTGGFWPGSTIKAPLCSTLILEDEDSEDRTLAVLQNHQADLSKIHVMDWVGTGNDKRPFCISTDLPRLEVKLNETPDLKLIILSPINAYIGLDDDKNAYKLRKVLSKLHDFAHRRGIAILGIAHPRKSTEGHVHDSLAGSHVWVAAARSVIMALSDVDGGNECRYFGVIKGNYTKEMTTLSYMIEEAFVDGEDGTLVGAPKIVWGTEKINESVESIFTRIASNSKDSEQPEAAEWLEGCLSDGPKHAKNIYALAKEAGFKDESTIRRARKKIGAVTYREGVGNQSCVVWALNAPDNMKCEATVNAGSDSIHGCFHGSENWEEA